MKAVVAALFLLVAPPLAAGISSEMYLDAPAGRTITREFDVAFSGTDYVAVWREYGTNTLRNVVVQRIAPTGQKGPRVEVAPLHRSWGGVAIAATGSLALVAWRECTGLSRCAAMFSWVERDTASVPFQLGVAGSLIYPDPGIAVKWNGTEFVAAWDHVRTGADPRSALAIARIRPYSTSAEVTLVAAACDPQNVVLAATQTRELVAWSRIDPGERDVCMVCPPPDPTAWLATITTQGAAARQLTSWERGEVESATAAGEKLFLAHSSLKSERFELLQLQPDRPERSALFIGRAPRIDGDGEHLVLLRLVRTEEERLFVVSRLDANEVGTTPSLHSPGGIVMSSDSLSLWSNDPYTLEPIRLAAGRSAALVLHRGAAFSRLAYRIVEFGSGDALPPPPEAVTVGSIAPAEHQGVMVSWRDPATMTTPLRYRISYLVADDPFPIPRGGTVERAGTAYLTGLAPDAPYILQIHSVSDLGLSEPFRAEFRTPPFGVPRQADNVTITPRSDGTAIVAWRDRSSSEVGYRIYEGIYEGFRKLIAEVGADVSTATIRLGNGRRSYSVVPFNASGEGRAASAIASSGRMRVVGRYSVKVRPTGVEIDAALTAEDRTSTLLRPADRLRRKAGIVLPCFPFFRFNRSSQAPSRRDG